MKSFNNYEQLTFWATL